MTLEAFKLLFAERPEAPEGVEFWEWVEMPEERADYLLHFVKPGSFDRAYPVGSCVIVRVGLWKPGGPPDGVLVITDWETRRVEYRAEREGALTA